MDELNILKLRIERMDRSRRLERVIGLAVLVGLALFVGLRSESMPSQTTKVVEANRFLIRDATGRVRVTLDSDGLVLADQNQVSRVGLQLDAAGLASVALQDSNGKVRVGLSVRAGPGQVALTFFDKNENGRIALALAPDGTPHLVFKAQGEKPGVALGFMPDETPYLVLRDGNLKPRVSLGLGRDGAPAIGLQDEDGHPRVLLTGRNVAVLRKDGTVLWSSPP